MIQREAKRAVERGEAWALAKTRLILAGSPSHRDGLASANDLTLGINAETVTVHRNGREVASFDVHLLTWSDEDLRSWKATRTEMFTVPGMRKGRLPKPKATPDPWRTASALIDEYAEQAWFVSAQRADAFLARGV